MNDTSPTPTLDEIIEHGNRGHRIVDNNWIMCADGTELSVVAGNGTYCQPRVAPCICAAYPDDTLPPPVPMNHGGVPHDYPGPYTHVEVLCTAPDFPTDKHNIAGYTPVEDVRAYVLKHGGESRTPKRTDDSDPTC